jgi:flavin reductase (DIM6/NTAB) family NADH-FMN oxidoreductase RutF
MADFMHAAGEITAPIEPAEIRRRFLEGMSLAACTVSVVTTDGVAGKYGVTVSAMASVSADTTRPTLLICIHHKSPAAAAILANDVFCVNILRDDQSYISDCFAGRLKAPDGDKFACAEWIEGATGALRVLDPLVAFDCRVVSSQQVGTHYVFFGSVEHIFVGSGGSPLIYANRAYGTPSRVDPAVEHRRALASLRIGVLQTFGPYIVPEIVERLTKSGLPIDLKLVEGDQRRILESLKAGDVDVALIYDIDVGRDVHIERLAVLRPYVLLAENDALAARPSLSLEELAEEPLVLLDAPTSGEYFLSFFSACDLQPNVRFRSSSFEMVRGLVGRGLGYSLLATKPATSMSYDGRALVTRPLSDETALSHITLAVRAAATLRPEVEAFMGACRELFPSGAPNHSSSI